MLVGLHREEVDIAQERHESSWQWLQKVANVIMIAKQAVFFNIEVTRRTTHLNFPVLFSLLQLPLISAQLVVTPNLGGGAMG